MPRLLLPASCFTAVIRICLVLRKVYRGMSLFIFFTIQVFSGISFIIVAEPSLFPWWSHTFTSCWTWEVWMRLVSASSAQRLWQKRVAWLCQPLSAAFVPSHLLSLPSSFLHFSLLSVSPSCPPSLFKAVFPPPELAQFVSSVFAVCASGIFSTHSCPSPVWFQSSSFPYHFLQDTTVTYIIMSVVFKSFDK